MVTSAALRAGRDPVPSDSRYELLLKIASGGMGTVYAGRLRGAKGFRRLVAIKRAHAHFVGDESFRKGLIAEAKLAARIHHANVVSVVDVEEPSEELLLVMDYVEGASLSQLVSAAGKRGRRLPMGVVIRVLLDVATGLHAAHELSDDDGQPLKIVHRDVSPQNILVGVDGAARIADFGIARSEGSTQNTTTGLKGKVGYMAPEYLRDPRAIDRRADVFALGVVAWEAIVGERLFKSDHELAALRQVLDSVPRRMAEVIHDVPAELDEVVARALDKDPNVRYSTALAFARDLEGAARRAGIEPSGAEVSATVHELFGEVLAERREKLKALSARQDAPLVPDASPRASSPGQITETAHVRGSISDARTVAVSSVLPPPAPVIDELAREGAQPEARARPWARWAGAAAIIGAGAAVLLSVALSGRRSAPPPAATPAPASSAPVSTDEARALPQLETSTARAEAASLQAGSGAPSLSATASARRPLRGTGVVARPGGATAAPPPVKTGNHPDLGY